MINNISAKALRARRIFTKVKKVLSPDKRKEYASFTKLRKDYYQHYWSRVANSLDATLEDIGQDYYRIRKGDHTTYVNASNVMLDDHVSLNIAGNKVLTHKLLLEVGYQGPRYLGYTLENIEEAQAFLKKIDGPTVVKPSSGTGAGNGITTEVRTRKELVDASIFASTCNQNLLIEEQVKGDSYRLLYLNGKFIDAVRRDQPVVTGDGSSTISQLIKIENDNRVNSATVTALSPLTISDELHTHLAMQDLTLTSVLAKGKTVTLKLVCNENSSNENHIVKDQVHSSIVNLGADLIKVLDLKLVGVDLITPDITVPLEQCGGVINELNTTPGLHHHELVFEKDQIANVGVQIIDYIFQKKAGT
ncbi:MAG: cyanophycin synthetase [Gammaproteobacteria bacterium]